MKSPRCMVTGLGLLLFYGTLAQADATAETGGPVQTDRIEYSTADRDSFQIVVFEEQVFLVAFAEKSAEEGRTWKLHLYGADFEERWSATHPRKRGQYLLAHDVDGKSAYLLLVRKRDFELLKIDGEGHGMEVTRGSLPAKFWPGKLEVHGDLAWLSGGIKKDVAILAIELDGGEYRQHLIDLDGTSRVNSIRASDRDSHVHVVVHNLLDKNNRVLVLDYAQNGEELARHHLESEDERWQLTDARLHHVDAERSIALGTYANSAKRSFKEAFWGKPRWGAQGIFFARLDARGNTRFTYHDFSEFENFFAYLPERKRKKTEEALADKKEEGGEPSLRYQLFLHDPILHAGAYVFVGEVHSTESVDTPPHTVTMPDGTTTSVPGSSIYLGEDYSHSVVAAFDEDGKRLWDHCFKMGSLYPAPAVRERVMVHSEGDRLSFLYVNGEAIESLVIDAGVAAPEQILTEIERGERDKKLYQGYGNVEFWYGNNYLIWGFQAFKKDKPAFKRERTYYVSRVSYGPGMAD